MKKSIALIIAFSISATALAQNTTPRDTSWKRGGYASLQFNQVAFSHWAAGGTNSLSLTAVGFGFANYTKGKNFWNSYANLNYGVQQQQYQRIPTKNTDLMELQTKAGHELGKKFFLSGLINFRSQFANGYNLPNDSVVVSKFMSPGYLTMSIGIDWRPTSYFSLYLSPATGKLTFVTDQNIADQVINGASLWGTDPAVYDSDGVLLSHGKTLRTEFGAYLAATFVKDIAKNVNVATKLQLFNNFTDENKPNRKNIDVNWDFLMNMKINAWLAASVFANLIYDQDVVITDYNSDGTPELDANGNIVAGPRTQFKEGIGIGLTYKFGDSLTK